MIHRKVPLFLLSVILVIASCRKDADESAPSVRILSPAAGHVLSIPDTLVVSVEVSDDRTVERVVISLLDPQGIPVGIGQTLTVNANSSIVQGSIVLTSERVLSGTYTVVARASDGDNEGRGFRDINVLETPWRLRSVFISPPPSTESVTITRMDSTGTWSNWLTVQDFNGMASDSYTQHLMVAGSSHAPFQAVPTAGGSTLWQLPTPMNDAPEQFTALTVDPFDGRTYFSTRDGSIRGFTGEGAQRFTAQCVTGNRCEAIVVLGDRLATWQRAIVGGTQTVIVYGIAGTIQASLPVEHEFVACLRLRDDRLLLFANEGGNGLIEQLNIDAGGTPELRTLPEGSISSVVRLNDDLFLLALPQRLATYRYSTNSLDLFATVPGVQAMDFDPATGSIFAGQGSSLFTLDANTGNVVTTIVTGSQIGVIQTLRNR